MGALDDPSFAMMVALERLRAMDEDSDPVGFGRAQLELAEALVGMARLGLDGVNEQAAPLLDEVIERFERNLPAARADLANARYLAGDIRRGRDWETARDHYEAGLRVARRDSESALWAALNEGLAAALIRGPQGDEPETQERSLGLYQEALTIEPPGVPREHWAHTAHNFALTLEERHRGDAISDWATIVELMGRALPLAFEDGDDGTKRAVYEMHGRARVAFGVLALLGSPLPAGEALGLVDAGAEALDVLRDPDDALRPWAAKLAEAVSDGGDARTAVDVGLVLLEHVGDRRGLILLHAGRCLWPDGDGERHLAEAERLLSPHDGQALRDAVERARAALSGPAEAPGEVPVAATPAPAPDLPLPFDDDELPQLRVFMLAQELVGRPGADGLEIELALKASRAALAAVHTKAARSDGLFTIGLLEEHRTIGDRQSNLEEARTSLEAALELVEPEDRSSRQSVLHNLGVVYKNRIEGARADNLEAAIRHLEDALACASRDDDPASWAMTASQLANTYTERVAGDQDDNAERALELYGQAMELRPKDQRPVEWAITQHNIASTLLQRRLGNQRHNLNEALRYAEEALTVRTEAELPDHFAMTQDTLADCRVALARSEPERALEHLDAAAAALEAAGRVWTLDRHRSRWLNNRLRLADILAERANMGGPDGREQAIALAEEALLAASPDAEPQQVLIARDRLATLFAERGGAGDLERAIGERQAMLETVEAAGDTAGLAMAAAALGRELATAERWDEAADAFRRALAAEADVAEAAVSLTTRWARMRLVGGLHTDAAYAMGRSSRMAWREALVTLERGRTRVLGDTFERDHRRLDALDRLGPDAVAARLAFLDAAAAMSALAGAELRSGGFGGTVPTPAVREEGRRTRARLVEAKAAIHRFPGFDSFLEPPGLEVVQDAARGGPPIVHLWATEQGGFAVASVSSESGEVRQMGIPLRLRSVDVDRMLFPAEADGWPGLLFAQRVGGEALDPVLERILRYVGEAIASPLRRLLWRLGAQRALLVLCGRLGALPILSAPYGPAEPSCLLDEFAIEVTPSASVAVAVRDSRRAGGGRTFVGLADAQPDTAPLPWAAAEVMGVAREAGADAPLVGETATRERAVRAMRGADVVHLACHGVFELAAPERSRLALADGDLAVADVLSERMLDGVRLVIASACESGAADLTRLPDEATGLPAALLQAGAAHVLGTLWPVSDLSASLLVARVASACLDPAAEPAAELAAAQRWLRGLGRDEAVSEARRLIDAAGDRHGDALEDDVAWLELAGPEQPFGEPQHWAPFVVVGA